MDSHTRSIGKALTWRVIAMLITAVTAWVVTGEAGVGITVGVIDSVVKIGAYYLHERAWTRVSR